MYFIFQYTERGENIYTFVFASLNEKMEFFRPRSVHVRHLKQVDSRCANLCKIQGTKYRAGLNVMDFYRVRLIFLYSLENCLLTRNYCSYQSDLLAAFNRDILLSFATFADFVALLKVLKNCY